MTPILLRIASGTLFSGNSQTDLLDPNLYFNIVVSLMIGPKVKAAFRS